MSSDPGITLVTISCNEAAFPTSAYGVTVDDVISCLFKFTASSDYKEYCMSFGNDGDCYGYATCNELISYSDCTTCLNEASNWIYSDCTNSIGAQVYLKDCRMRYENYPFSE